MTLARLYSELSTTAELCSSNHCYLLVTVIYSNLNDARLSLPPITPIMRGEGGTGTGVRPISPLVLGVNRLSAIHSVTQYRECY